MTNDRTPSLRLRRRLDLQVTEQWFGGRRFWVLKDPIAWRYVKLNEQEFAIWQLLDGQIDPAAIQRDFERRFAPQKLQLAQLQIFLGDLHRKGLVLADAPGQGQQLLIRERRQRRAERWGAVSGLLAVRFRGFNPDPLLDRLYPLVRPVLGPAGLLAAVLLVLAAVLLLAVQFEELRARLPEFQAFFHATNLIWIAAVLGGTKVLHELGHGLTCKHFGARCHELGVMLLVFVPCLYCNVSDAWTLPGKWQRIAVTAAGVWVELTLAALCTFLWWFSEPGLFNTLCLNTMFVCSVSTLLFNGNPLLRYDGYYVLADWWEVPNLWQQSRGYLRSVLRRIGLGLERYDDLAWRTEQRGKLLVYGLASIAYRWVVLLAILVFLYRLFEPLRLQVVAQAIGLLVVVGAVAGPVREGWQVISSPSQRRGIRWSRCLVSAGLLGLLLAAVAALPLPFRVAGPLVIEPAAAQRLYVVVRGELAERNVQPGDPVSAGQRLAVLHNPELAGEVLELEGAVRQQRTRLEALQARRGADPDVRRQIPAAAETLRDLEHRLQRRQEEQDKLTLRAAVAGVVLPPPAVAPLAAESGRLPVWSGTPLEPRNLGSTLEPGTLFCLIGDPLRLEAIVYLDQTQVEFVRPGQTARLAIATLPGHVLTGRVVELAQREAKLAPRELTSQDLPLRSGADGESRPLQAPFQVRIRLEDQPFPLPIGSRGEVKILVQSQTLGHRLLRLLKETFRFRLGFGRGAQRDQRMPEIVVIFRLSGYIIVRGIRSYSYSGVSRYSYSNGLSMTEPIFDHDRLDVYRLSIGYVAASFRIAKELNGLHRHARDQWLRAAQSIPLNIAEGNGKRSLNHRNRFLDIARGSALGCASIQDVLAATKGIEDEQHGD